MYTIQDAITYANQIWPEIEGCFVSLSHGESHYVSSIEGAKEILWIFSDWVENNGGWKIIQACDSSGREATIHQLIFLGAKKYIENQNLDMNCESNIGVGREDIKICRGNDKTVIEVKLSTNPDCKHGYEEQLPRYAEAEHTDNMIFVLVRVDDKVIEIQERNKPELKIIDARPQKTASKK